MCVFFEGNGAPRVTDFLHTADTSTYGGGIVVLYQGVKLDDSARTDHIYHVIEALACYGGTKP